jgi:hypothetical protein
VQTIHDLWNRSTVIPEVNIENVNVGGTKLLETLCNADMQILCTISNAVDLQLDSWVIGLVVDRVLREI